jgi:hypothetical protein
MLLLGAGPRALLLQIAHPAVAAGVAEHSDFRTDPWQRYPGRCGPTCASCTARRIPRAPRSGAWASSTAGSAATCWSRTGGSGTAAATAPWTCASRCGSTRRSSTRRWPPSMPGWSRCTRPARPLLRGDAAGGRAFGIPASAAAGPRRVRGVPRRDARPGGPIEVGPAPRPRRRRSATRRSAARSRPGRRVALLAPMLNGIPSRAYSWLFWPSIGLLPPRRPRGLRPAVGAATAGRRHVARPHRGRPGGPMLPPDVPPDAAGDRGRSPGRRRDALLSA